MKCPKCESEWESYQTCPVCGMVEDSGEYVDAVNLLLTNAAEEDIDAGLGW